MLTLQVPRAVAVEARWACEVVLREFLGLDVAYGEHDGDTYRLSADGRELLLPDIFLRQAVARWLDPCTLPAPGHTDLRPRSDTTDPLPVLFGSGACTTQDGTTRVDADIFGAMFFMLSRYEEAVPGPRDAHGRYPAEVSHAQRAGYLSRPLADEYVEWLWRIMLPIWPGLRRSAPVARILVSCDVDEPFPQNRRSALRTARAMARDVVEHRAALAAGGRLLDFLLHRTGCDRFDPVDTFDWIMDANEFAGNRVTFYFLSNSTVPRYDADYSIDDPRIRALMRRIHARGHLIGLHGSYASCLDTELLRREVALLRRAMEAEHIAQASLGCRQHYLRWQPDTPARQQDAGLEHDSTLGYADRAGFRCGTCHEYPMFDVNARQPLRIRQRPLVLMESTVLARRYMNLPREKSTLAYMTALKQRCASTGGDFTLLWHNSHFLNRWDRRAYRTLISN